MPSPFTPYSQEKRPDLMAFWSCLVLCYTLGVGGRFPPENKRRTAAMFNVTVFCVECDRTMENVDLGAATVGALTQGWGLVRNHWVCDECTKYLVDEEIDVLKAFAFSPWIVGQVFSVGCDATACGERIEVCSHNRRDWLPQIVEAGWGICGGDYLCQAHNRAWAEDRQAEYAREVRFLERFED